MTESSLKTIAQRLNRLDSTMGRVQRRSKRTRAKGQKTVELDEQSITIEQAIREATYLLVAAQNGYTRGVDVSTDIARLDALVNRIENACASAVPSSDGAGSPLP